MFLLGIVGVLQVIWLPGFILLRIANIRTSRIGNLAFGFGLSLTFNYVLVLILVSLKIFYQWLLLIIIGIEIVIALWITRKQWTILVGDTFRNFWLSLIEKFTAFLVNLKSHFTKKEYGAIFRKISFIFFFLLALIPLWWVIRIFADNLGTVLTRGTPLFPGTPGLPNGRPTTYLSIPGAILSLFRPIGHSSTY